MNDVLSLPAPQTELTFPLMKALETRRTTRKWADAPVPQQEVSNLLWAAGGITKRKTGRVKSKRTVPSACNAQEIRIYVLMETGVYVYDEERHALTRTRSGDIRQHIGTQKMMRSAPLGLVFVADLSRMTSPFLRGAEAQRFCAWVDTGYISQNVYLYCAAAGLATTVISLVNRDALHALMQLQEHEKIVLTQAVGLLSRSR